MLSLLQGQSRHHTHNRQSRSHAHYRAVTLQRTDGLNCRPALSIRYYPCYTGKALSHEWSFWLSQTTRPGVVRRSLTPRFIEVSEWTGRDLNCFNSFGPPQAKPLKRFRVERSTHDTHLKVGVNEKIMPGRLSNLDVKSALSNRSQF